MNVVCEFAILSEGEKIWDRIKSPKFLVDQIARRKRKKYQATIAADLGEATMKGWMSAKMIVRWT